MTAMPDRQRRQLLALAAQGDRAAQGEVVRACLPRVRELVHKELDRDFRQHHRWLLPLISTGDIVQDVLLRVLPELAGVDLETDDDLARYLTTLVHHRLIDTVRHYEAKRRDQRRHAVGERDPQATGTGPSEPAACVRAPPDLAALTEQVEIFGQVLGEFSARHRALLDLRLRDEESYAVIAEKLGYASEESARQAFAAAHARLLLKLRARGVRAGASSAGG